MVRPALALVALVSVAGCGGATASSSATARFALAGTGGYAGPASLSASGDGSVFLTSDGARRTLTVRNTTVTLTVEFAPTGGSQDLNFGSGSDSRARLVSGGGTWVATSGTFTIRPALGTTSFFTGDLGFVPDASVIGNSAMGTFVLSGTGDLQSK